MKMTTDSKAIQNRNGKSTFQILKRCKYKLTVHQSFYKAAAAALQYCGSSHCTGYRLLAAYIRIIQKVSNLPLKNCALFNELFGNKTIRWRPLAANSM